MTLPDIKERREKALSRLNALNEFIGKHNDKLLIYKMDAKFISVYIVKIKDDFVVYRIFEKWDAVKKQSYGKHIIIRDLTFNENDKDKSFDDKFGFSALDFINDFNRDLQMDHLGIKEDNRW